MPVKFGCTFATVSVGVPEPLMPPPSASGRPLKRQRYVSVALPTAVAAKLALLPALTVRFVGCAITIGASGPTTT